MMPVSFRKNGDGRARRVHEAKISLIRAISAMPTPILELAAGRFYSVRGQLEYAVFKKWWPEQKRRRGL